MRRLSIGTTYRFAIATLRVHWPTLVAPALLLGAVSQTPILAAGTSSGIQLAVAAVSLFASFLYYGYVEAVAHAEEPDRDRVSIGATLRSVAPIVPKLMLASLLMGSLIVAGLVLFIIPGLWLIGRYGVVTAVVSAERLGPIRAVRRSGRLVKGAFWPVMVTIVTMLLLEGALEYGAESGVHAIAGSAHIASFIGATLGVTLGSLVGGLVVSGMYTQLVATDPDRQEPPATAGRIVTSSPSDTSVSSPSRNRMSSPPT